MFQRRPKGLYAHRVASRPTSAFNPRASFGIGIQRRFEASWLNFQTAPPERRIDLDLPGPLPLKSPLALAFYWVRWLPSSTM